MTDLSQSSFYGDKDQYLRGPKGDPGPKGDQGPAGPPGLDLPTFPNNAAALAGGLTTNRWYKTASGEVRVVV